jgi:hypothetical protein
VQLTTVEPHEIGYPWISLQITLKLDYLWTYVGWSLPLRKEHKLKAFVNKKLSKICDPETKEVTRELGRKERKKNKQKEQENLR